MNTKRTFQQVIEFLGDFGVETRVCVFEDDSLSSGDDGFCVFLMFEDGFGNGFDVGPFSFAGAPGC